ncbi:hypothetical protein [Nonomuraea lactucae]|uniref:hypothetical protein n=1 Tax=Nonomuraea lactucae TaxID=2249762 RepID=UPI0019652B3A|nr:hypothetical protein [Nonomuraea lactucae]
MINVVVGFFIVIASMEQNSGTSAGFVAAGAVVLALVGLGAGTGLLFVRRPWATGLGLGLMIGWALWSIVSAGFCTGLNPELYA